MARVRWWNKDLSPKRTIPVLAGLLAAVIIGVLVAVSMTSSHHDTRMVHQPINELEQIRVPGSVRRTSIVSTGCGGYVPPIARRTDWSNLPAAEVEEQTATRVLAAGWTRAPAPSEDFVLDGMTMTLVAEPMDNGGSRLTTSIAAPEPCNADQ